MLDEMKDGAGEDSSRDGIRDELLSVENPNAFEYMEPKATPGFHNLNNPQRRYEVVDIDVEVAETERYQKLIDDRCSRVAIESSLIAAATFLLFTFAKMAVRAPEMPDPIFMFSIGFCLAFFGAIWSFIDFSKVLTWKKSHRACHLPRSGVAFFGMLAFTVIVGILAFHEACVLAAAIG